MSDTLEMWGGVECSIVRIQGTTRNQLLETGHFDRIADLDLIGRLGITTLRYPLSWEIVEPVPGCFDWSWPDARLERLRELGIKPIAGLVHHGSGPPQTDMLDPAFPAMLARYAGLLAQRYPWLELFTPVNEPLTTARIAGLYGLWSPHGYSEAICLQLTVAQCRAIAQSMKAIRIHISQAQLVQTEDVGRIFATEHLAYQAAHENERRWLSLDLLTGRVNARHPFYHRLLAAGVDRLHLAELEEEPCPPDVIGIDYYLTSDRVLDHRIDRYSGEQIGGNDIDSYVDIAAFRSDMHGNRAGLGYRLEELWERYGLPIAVTELHNGSTRDEQLRWLVEGWRTAQAAKASGIDIRSVTAWSLFGAVDWNSMLVAKTGHYESGAFDIRAESPRPTAVAKAIAELAKKGSFDHPVLDRPGWWWPESVATDVRRPILLIGFGRLISIVEECCHARRLTVRPAQLDTIQQLLTSDNAWAAIGIENARSGHSAATMSSISLSCQYPNGARIMLQCPASLAGSEIANAFLDLVIDGQCGMFELSWIGSNNQYEVVVPPNDAKVRRAI